jgi:hypothetical protein
MQFVMLMMELTEDFLTLLITAVLIIGVLSVFLIFIYYNIIVNIDESRREVFILGDTLLSNLCLTDGLKGLFSEEKLDQLTADASCLGELNIDYIAITIYETGEIWNIKIENTNIGRDARFDVNVKLETGETKLAEMVVVI